MSFDEKQKEKIRREIINLYEGKIRDIAESTGYCEEYIRQNLMWDKQEVKKEMRPTEEEISDFKLFCKTQYEEDITTEEAIEGIEDGYRAWGEGL